MLYPKLINYVSLKSLKQNIFDETLDEEMTSNLTKHRGRYRIAVSWFDV